MHIDPNEFFRKATLKICGNLDIEKSMRELLTYLREYLPVDKIHLHIYKPDLDILKAIIVVAYNGAKNSVDIIPMFDDGRNERQLTWADMEVFYIVNRPELDPKTRSLQYFKRSPNSSLIILRLELAGQRIGTFGVETEGRDRYTEEHAQLLMMLHEPIAIAMSNALQYKEVLKLKEQLTDDNRFLQREILNLANSEIVGIDFGLRSVIELVRQVAPTNSPVLLLGETGVGKDMIATAIHYFSKRKNNPFVRVNCGAFPASLVDSELFGHEKGSFTGATEQKRGRFERADKGTIFLDEIGELSLEIQVKLLHVLQNREIERIGGTKPIPIDTRILSATNRNLEEMVKRGEFRKDLWYRLNVFPITIPPLRERKEDIPELAHYFIERKVKELKIGQTPKLGPGSLKLLINYEWPGNVREFENVIERALIRRKDGLLDFGNLSPNVSDTKAGDPAIEYSYDFLNLDDLTTFHIRRTLKHTKGKISGPGGAAELLGVNPNTLRKRMNKLAIPFKKQKGSNFDSD
jgi:transcriptional regulator with GAF, ATPase, and Fis domain